MKLCKCERGHFYDQEKFTSCPMCVDEGNDGAGSGMTEAELPISEIVAEAMELPVGGVADAAYELPVGGVTDAAYELPVGGVADAAMDLPIGGVEEKRE